MGHDLHPDIEQFFFGDAGEASGRDAPCVSANPDEQPFIEIDTCAFFVGTPGNIVEQSHDHELILSYLE